MFTLIRAPLVEQLSSLRRCSSRHVCCCVSAWWSVLLTHTHSTQPPRPPASVPGHTVLHQAALGGWRTGGSRRCYTTVRRAVGKNRSPNTYTSMVDPQREEQFVFLDYVVEEEEHLPRPNPIPPMAPQPGQVTLAEKHRRTLQQQLKSLRSETEEQVKPDPSAIEFADTDFPLDEDLVKTAKKRRKNVKARGEQKVFGTPDLDEPASSTCCSGCGAVLHCSDQHTAGYMPSEKFKPLAQEEEGGGLRNAVCQRCYLLTHHKKALEVKMSKEDYRNVVSGIKSHKALVLLIVDLLDLPDSVVPDPLGLVGRNKHVVVLGNKVDLLPADAPNYLQRIRRQLTQYCSQAGLGDNVKDVHLISAKTGYGVENLISSLQRSWKYQGDVFLVGTANAGKSTLFNTLLDSDYCKTKGSEVIHKATISPWPGTTLNLLKFPIINPTPYRMFRRQERLQTASSQTEGDLSPEELKRLQHFSKQGYLVGRVGRTFRVQADRSRRLIEFDPDSLAYSEEDSGEDSRPGSSAPVVEFTHNELKDAHWLYDTPGIMKEQDLLSLLTEEEVKMVVATKAIVPRTFVLKPGMTLFLGAVGRIDYLKGEKSCWLSVVASNMLPVHITSLERADDVYLKHSGHSLLGVPMGGEERMKDFPPLVWEEFTLEGQGHLTASADLTLSSAGWVAVTGVEGDQMLLRAHRPQGTSLGLRTPPLLPHIVNVKGERVRKSAAYKTTKPPALVDSTMSHKGAQRLNVQQKKKKKKKSQK